MVRRTRRGITGSLEKIGTDEVKVRVLHAAVGGINESDVTLAGATDAIIIGFNVQPGPFQAGAAVQTDATDKALQEFFNALVRCLFRDSTQHTVTGAAVMKLLTRRRDQGLPSNDIDGLFEREPKVSNRPRLHRR